MAAKAEKLARAKEIIEAYPEAGAKRVNAYLGIEYGRGLRRETILRLKREVATEHPKLAPQLYATGSVAPSLNAIYYAWQKAGFIPYEARELTVGHGERYRAFDAKAVFDSDTAKAARHTRQEMIRRQLANGWTKQEIRDNILDFYRKSKDNNPWEIIRAEYKPRKRIDHIDYRDAVRARARSKLRRLYH